VAPQHIGGSVTQIDSSWYAGSWRAHITTHRRVPGIHVPPAVGARHAACPTLANGLAISACLDLAKIICLCSSTGHLNTQDWRLLKGSC